jgi:CRP-like cAMP-binding protein
MADMAQQVACNRLHSIQQRCPRWLLTTRDRVRTDEFPLTQEFLAQMLGVRRASINEVAQALQKQGLIHYQRGIITILDAEGLKAAACQCYQIVRAQYDQMLDDPFTL